MDRHDMSGSVTAENVAELHQKDLKIQDEYNCRGVTYWFDDKRKLAFCLIEAPDENAIVEMHNAAHGGVPHKIIEVEADTVELFLGRIEDPVNTNEGKLNIISEPAFRIILRCELMNKSCAIFNDKEIRDSLQQFFFLVNNITDQYNGSKISYQNYYYLSSFASVNDAIDCSLEIQSIFRGHFSDAVLSGLDLKITLSSGEPVDNSGRLFDDAIKHAGRMCEIADSEIVISSEVSDIYQNENHGLNVDSNLVSILSTPDEKFLNSLMNYLEDNLHDCGMTIDDIAGHLALSRSHYYRKLVALTNKSPNKFLMDYRLKKSLDLIRQNVHNISEISFRLGFSSPSYFSKRFRERYGNKPSKCFNDQ